MASGVDDSEPGARVRLHITPFNEDLLDRIIPPSIKPLATNISFHFVQTFPERGFGYVELPTMDAQKLKTKLNGSTLKGAKVHIEEAKLKRQRDALENTGDADLDSEKSVRKKAKREKRKQEQGVLSGHELEDGRRVKRGWGNGGPEDARRQNKRKAIGEADEGKMLFRTSIPPNMAPVQDESKDKSKKKRKGKESKRKKIKTIVTEFSRSRKSQDVSGVHSGDHGRITYRDGHGWMHENEVVSEEDTEPQILQSRQRSTSEDTAASAQPSHASMAGVDATTEQEIRDHAIAEAALLQPPIDTPQVSPSNAEEVHPLEALFKRPVTSPSDSARPRPTPIDTSFSFFDTTSADGDVDVDADMPPQTPHTRRDLEWRSIRSAAPTPDTAAIGRKFSFPFAAGVTSDDEDEGDDQVMEDVEPAEPGAAKPDEESKEEESAFRKWFYEHRGEFNRGWKKRRREERKSKRQRDNHQLSQKIA